jgi:hypothetical protein
MSQQMMDDASPMSGALCAVAVSFIAAAAVAVRISY